MIPVFGPTVPGGQAVRKGLVSGIVIPLLVLLYLNGAVRRWFVRGRGGPGSSSILLVGPRQGRRVGILYAIGS